MPKALSLVDQHTGFLLRCSSTTSSASFVEGGPSNCEAEQVTSLWCFVLKRGVYASILVSSHHAYKGHSECCEADSRTLRIVAIGFVTTSCPLINGETLAAIGVDELKVFKMPIIVYHCIHCRVVHIVLVVVYDNIQAYYHVIGRREHEVPKDAWTFRKLVALFRHFNCQVSRPLIYSAENALSFPCWHTELPF